MTDTAWFRRYGWGVFTHYLTGKDTTAGDWNRQVDAFDVERLAEQLASVGAVAVAERVARDVNASQTART